MNGRKLQDLAREVAEELPGSAAGHPFGLEYEVFKVRGKVFMLMTEVPGDPIVVLKADPQDSEALRQEHSAITPGYHMNKRHWITLGPGQTVDAGLVRELVMESYRLVVAGLPRADRPIDPERFGTAEKRVPLSGERVQEVARNTAGLLPQVSNGRPFTEGLDVYKVANKVFLIVTDDPDELIITVKAEPDRGSFLRREYPAIVRGRYLDKKHWVSVGAGSGISEQLVKDLVEGSYELVRSS